ncbi:hypothetical protein F441_16388, partial [Phytophthora nicotianae CJ01A1]
GVPAPNLCCTRHKVNFSNRVNDEDTQRASDSSHACKQTLNDDGGCKCKTIRDRTSGNNDYT